MYTSSLNSASILQAHIRQDIALIFVAQNTTKQFFKKVRRYSYLFAAFLAFFSFSSQGGYAAPAEQEYVVTAYYSPLPGQSFYLKWNYKAEVLLNGNGTHGASGRPVFVGMVAAPKSYDFGTRINFSGLWVGIVEDRGGAIVNAWEKWQSYDRIDIWMGTGEAWLRRAMIWGKRKVKWSITTDESLPVLNFKDIDTGKIDLSQFPRATNTTSSSGLPANILAMFDDLGYPKEDGQSEKEMIIEFQLDHGIIKTRDDDGAWIYGPRTRAMLESEHDKYITLRNAEFEKIEAEKAALLSEKTAWESSYTVANQVVESIGTPKKWDSGHHVLALQKALKTAGVLKGRMNGTMGTPTILALRTFQRKNKIPVTGQIDSKTKEALLISLVENA